MTGASPHTKELNVMKEIHPLWRRCWRCGCNTWNRGLSPCLSSQEHMGWRAGRKSCRVPVIFERFDGAKFVRFGRRKCSVGKWLRQETDQLAVCHQPLCLSSNSAICTQNTWPEAARQWAAASSRSSRRSVAGSPRSEMTFAFHLGRVFSSGR